MTTKLPPITATQHARTVPAQAVHLDFQKGDIIGGALYWISDQDERQLALTTSGHAVFAEEIQDCWKAVESNINTLDDWHLVVDVAGLRLNGKAHD